MESIAPVDGPYVLLDGKKLLDFSSCDFLGLSQHPEVKKGAIKYALKYGVGASSLSVISTPQLEIQSKLAHYLGKESALLFSSESELHKELEKLGAIIVSAENGSAKAKGLKVSDETYLFGMTGANGFGSTSDGIICGSFLCCSGAFIAGTKKQLSELVSGRMSFPALGALDCALSFIPEMEIERKMVQKHKSWLVKELSKFSIEELRSSRVILLSKEADQIRQFLLQEQIYLAPSQNKNLYFAITALHTPDDLDLLSCALKKLSTTDLALAMQSLTPTP